MGKKQQEKKKIRRKVVCVWGRFDNGSDFVLEPLEPDEMDAKDGFWIEGEEQ